MFNEKPNHRVPTINWQKVLYAIQRFEEHVYNWKVFDLLFKGFSEI